VLLLCYAFSFGVELTVNNNLPSYLSSQFGYDYLVAGALSSTFGLMNLISRPCGEWPLDPLCPRSARQVQVVTERHTRTKSHAVRECSVAVHNCQTV